MFSDNKNKKKKYSSVTDYELLSDIEHIRLRPGNYIGSTDSSGWHHLLMELIDNSSDEALVGNCTKIEVYLSDDQKTVTVKDNGNGIPIGVHHETGKSVLVTICAYLKSGGKFSDKIYKTSGGLHGIGLTAVNALSVEFKICNIREGKKQFAHFSRGELIEETVSDVDEQESSFSVSFSPDSLIFSEFTHFRIDIINNRLKELSCLIQGLTLSFYNHLQKEPTIYKSDNGLIDLLYEVNESNSFLLGTEPCAEKWTRFSDPYVFLEYCWQYSEISSKKYFFKSYCNNIYTPDGGTHIDGFENGFCSAARDFIKEKLGGGLHLKIPTIHKEDILLSLCVIFSLRISDPQFSAQTKRSLTNKYVREIVRDAVYDLTKKFFQDHANSAESIIEKIINSARSRVKMEEYQSSLRDNIRVSLPGKLTPCISKNVEDISLFLVEGDSAGGSSKLARNPNTQAILPLKGKTINVEKKEEKKVFKNEEIRNIANSLGITVGEMAKNLYNFLFDESFNNREVELEDDFLFIDKDGNEKKISAHEKLSSDQLFLVIKHTKEQLIKKLRYGKIIIMTDSDFDGDHIGALQFTFFWSFFRYIIEEGRLYLANPPLYRWQSKKEVLYFYDDNELKEYQKNNKLSGGHLQRFKGLGEMDPIHLRETTMHPQKGRLYKVMVTDIPGTYRVVKELMATDSKKRCYYLESGKYKNMSLEVVDNQVELHHSLMVKFLNYAHAVVENRAIPREDGLKPVQRRIVNTMYEIGLFSSSIPRKSAKIVGDVVGKYHPHGDSSVYQAMVKMAQDFNYRYPLIKGYGNWGSQDGDNAAHMRYTEARLTKFGESLLEDLKYKTVPFVENYDSTCQEPYILPASLNILANGSSGIAVGMSTDIPPHNLSEISKAASYLISYPETSVEELLEKVFVAPDFPTGGEILDGSQLKDLYKEGKGVLHLRSRFLLESSEGKKVDTIKVFSIPYKIPKSKIVQKISDIIKAKKIEGLKSVEDYSSLENKVNIHIKFDPNYDSNIIMNKLYKETDLQTTIRVAMRVLINNKPQILSLVDILNNFNRSRLNHIKSKAKFIRSENEKELDKLEVKCFIIDNYYKIAEIVKEGNEESIKKKLQDYFSLDKNRASRVLETSYNFLQFTPERKKKLEKEIENLKVENLNWTSLIDNEEERKKYLLKELDSLCLEYDNDVRRTLVTDKPHFVLERELIPYEERTLSLSILKDKSKIQNYLTVNSISLIENTRIPGSGKILKTRGDPWFFTKANRRDDLLLFTNHGKVFILNLYKIAGVNKTVNLDEEYYIRQKEGKMVPFLGPLEYFVFCLPVSEKIYNNKELSLLIVTKKGRIKFFDISFIKKSALKKSGKKIFASKNVFRCLKHNNEYLEHKNKVHSCGIECSVFREIRKKTLSCFDCIVSNYKSDNEDCVVKALFVNKKDDLVDAVVKRRSSDRNIKNRVISLARYVRKRESVNVEDNEVFLLSYCVLHKSKAIEHYIFHRKENNICSILSCDMFLGLKNNVFLCKECSNPENFVKRWKRRLKTEMVVDLISYSPLLVEKSKKISFLIIRKNGIVEKKSFSSSKKNLGLDIKVKRTNYCKKHWFELSELERLKEKTQIDVQDERNNLEKRIINSPLPIEEKEKIAKKNDLLDNELFKKRILSSLVDPLLSQKSVEEQFRELIQFSKTYQKVLQNRDLMKNKMVVQKETIKECSNCQKYCSFHKEEILNHRNVCNHCNSLNSELSVLENDIIFISSSKNKDNEKVIDKELLVKNEQKRSLKGRILSLYGTCEILNSFKDCLDCQNQVQKKFLLNVNNPIEKVFLIHEKILEPEIFILTTDYLLLSYGKNDLISFFLLGKNKVKSFLKSNKSLMYINLIYKKSE